MSRLEKVLAFWALALHLFLNEAVDGAEVFLLRHKVAAGEGAELLGGEEDHQDHADGDGREGQAQHQHGDKDADHVDGAVEQLGQALADHLAEGVDVVGVDGHDVAVGMGVKVADGQLFHVGEQILPQVPQGALGDVDHHAGLDEAGDHAAGVEQGHAGDGVHEAGEIRRLPGLDLLDQGEDIAVDEGLCKERTLHHGKDADEDGDDHENEVQPVFPAHVFQDTAQRLAGVVQLGPGAAAAGAGHGSCLFCHYASPPSSKSPPPLVWDS